MQALKFLFRIKHTLRYRLIDFYRSLVHPIVNFDIVYINLESSSERRSHIEQMLKRIGVNRAERFPAIDGKDPIVTQKYEHILNRDVDHYLSREEHKGRRSAVIGCYLSHLLIMQSRRGVSGYTLILEDDVVIHSRLLFSRLSWFIRNCKHDWDILLLDCGGTGKPSDRLEHGVYRPSATYPQYAGAYAVVVKNPSIPKILAELEKCTIMDIDGIYLMHITNIRALVLRTGYVRHDYGFPSIIT